MVGRQLSQNSNDQCSVPEQSHNSATGAMLPEALWCEVNNGCIPLLPLELWYQSTVSFDRLHNLQPDRISARLLITPLPPGLSHSPWKGSSSRVTGARLFSPIQRGNTAVFVWSPSTKLELRAHLEKYSLQLSSLEEPAGGGKPLPAAAHCIATVEVLLVASLLIYHFLSGMPEHVKLFVCPQLNPDIALPLHGFITRLNLLGKNSCMLCETEKERKNRWNQILYLSWGGFKFFFNFILTPCL